MFKRLNIFVHSASECLTDHLPHGDGLICKALFQSLLDRGHSIWATTKYNGLRQEHPRLKVTEVVPCAPAHSLHALEYNLRIDRQFRRWVNSGVHLDIAWRLHPFGIGCPSVPRLGDLPFAVGPIYYEWPGGAPPPSRFGVSIRSIVEPLARRGWEKTLRQAALVLGSTPSHATKLRKHLCSENGQRLISDIPVIVSPSANAINCMSSRDLPQLDSGVKVALIAGLRENKRPLVVAETVGLLRESGFQVELTVCGDGPLRDVLQEYAKQAGWSQHLDLKGNIPNDQVYEVLARSHLLLSPSIGEPYGRNIVEAMSVGTPAIAHRSGGPAEIITHAVNGWLVEESTPHAFAAAIQASLSANRWQQLSSAAIAAAQQWRSQDVGARLESLFEEARMLRRNAQHSNSIA